MSDNSNLRVPAFCPICEGMMRGKSGDTYYRYGCCVQCFIQWVEGPSREKRWLDGWRPSAEQVEAFKEALSASC